MVRVKYTPKRNRNTVKKRIGDCTEAIRCFRITQKRYKNTKQNRRLNRVGLSVYKYVIGKDREAAVDFAIR